MALVFSKVTIDTDGESVEFLVSGSPKTKTDSRDGLHTRIL